MRKIITTLVLLCFLCFQQKAAAQTAPQGRYKIAVFVPLYLDSIFDGEVYKYGNHFPKFISPGLEFYEGVQIAADSLKKYNSQLDIYISDTRSPKMPLAEQLNSDGIKDANLFVGLVNNSEAKMLAEAALKKNISFISADLPNDAGITNNPSYVILKSTLKTHCEGIYKFVQKNYSLAPVVVFTKKGPLEDRLKAYFEDCMKTVPGTKVPLKFVLLDDASMGSPMAKHLDSSRTTVSIVSSMDESFGKKVVYQLSQLNKDYPTVAIGMPTWDGIDEFNKRDYKGLDIIYSTSFYNPRSDKTSSAITSYFKQNVYSRPSDMVFRGYECLYRFARLLIEKGGTLSNSVGEKKYKVFTDFDLQPVLNRQTNTLDYFENKKLYFIKKVDGSIKSVL